MPRDISDLLFRQSGSGMTLFLRSTFVLAMRVPWVPLFCSWLLLPYQPDLTPHLLCTAFFGWFTTLRNPVYWSPKATKTRHSHFIKKSIFLPAFSNGVSPRHSPLPKLSPDTGISTEGSEKALQDMSSSENHHQLLSSDCRRLYGETLGQKVLHMSRLEKMSWPAERELIRTKMQFWHDRRKNVVGGKNGF